MGWSADQRSTRESTGCTNGSDRDRPPHYAASLSTDGSDLPDLYAALDAAARAASRRVLRCQEGAKADAAKGGGGRRLDCPNGPEPTFSLSLLLRRSFSRTGIRNGRRSECGTLPFNRIISSSVASPAQTSVRLPDCFAFAAPEHCGRFIQCRPCALGKAATDAASPDAKRGKGRNRWHRNSGRER